MKTAGFAALLMALASPVLAHGGAHVHPHGTEIPLAVMLAALVVAAATVVFMNRK